RHLRLQFLPHHLDADTRRASQHDGCDRDLHVQDGLPLHRFRHGRRHGGVEFRHSGDLQRALHPVEPRGGGLTMRAQRRLRLMLVYLVVGPLAAVILFPVLVMLSTAVKPRTEVFAFPPTWLPSTIRWANFAEMWKEADFGRALLNSLWIGFASTGLALLIATPAAYALARLRFAGRGAYLYLVLITQMFSPIVIVISLFKQMSYYNLLNTYTSLIVTYAAFSLAFCIWLLSKIGRAHV